MSYLHKCILELFSSQLNCQPSTHSLDSSVIVCQLPTISLPSLLSSSISTNPISRDSLNYSPELNSLLPTPNSLSIITSYWASLYSLGANRTQNTISYQSLYCCLRILCRRNVFTELLPSNKRLLWFHYSGLQTSYHNTYIMIILISQF
jgi:hypothetical protein